MPICLNCKNSFPNFTNVNKKKRNLQRRKFCLVCSPFGNHNTSKIPPIKNVLDGSIEKICCLCKKLYPKTKEFFFQYKNGTLKYCCKKCESSKNIQFRRDIKIKAVEYKGGKCIICGYSKCIQALKFHHIDPSKKDFSVGTEGSCRSWEKLKPELDKCILICGNCHDETHYGFHPQYLVVKDH